ncbi:hypothetical protein [Endozoicomonas euniceicola]|uniref:Curli production assembly/transport component CsgE n=1 Tax=Endozoicomonas euniceicola TaxID=1234143 RepID=A0ABY6GV62_9GAMM|nr:hypothetical protein [Endozoicomonas euniceicola]UYM16658.1 hypothetical protein NX720_01625 [Endozoicomonas euniceicola]
MKTCNTHIVLFLMVIFCASPVLAVNYQQFIIQLNGMPLLEITKRQKSSSQGASYNVQGVSPANRRFVRYNLAPDTSEQALTTSPQSVPDPDTAFLEESMALGCTNRSYIGDLLPALIYTHHQLGGRSFDITIHDDGNAELNMEVEVSSIAQVKIMAEGLLEPVWLTVEPFSHIEAQVTLDSVGPAPWDNFLDSTSTSDNRLLHYLFNYINHSQLSRFIDLANEHNNGTAPASSNVIRIYQQSYFNALAEGHSDNPFSIDLNSSNQRFDSNLDVQIRQSGEDALVLNVVGVVNRSGLGREILGPLDPLYVELYEAANLILEAIGDVPLPVTAPSR